MLRRMAKLVKLLIYPCQTPQECVVGIRNATIRMDGDDADERVYTFDITGAGQ